MKIPINPNDFYLSVNAEKNPSLCLVEEVNLFCFEFSGKMNKIQQEK